MYEMVPDVGRYCFFGKVDFLVGGNSTPQAEDMVGLSVFQRFFFFFLSASLQKKIKVLEVEL